MFVESLNFRCHLPERAQTGPVTAGMPSLKGEAVCPSVLVTTPTLHGDGAPETGLLVTAAGSLGPGRREGGPGGVKDGVPIPREESWGLGRCHSQLLRSGMTRLGAVLQPLCGPGDGQFRVDVEGAGDSLQRAAGTRGWSHTAARGRRVCGRRTRHSLLLTEVASCWDSSRDRSQARRPQLPPS